MDEKQNPEKVFISYSHDSEEHVAKALDLANRLREDGVDAILDQYEEAPEEGWPRWMDRQIHEADYVLVIGSVNYFNRLLGTEEDGKGLGAKWEGAILYQHLYERDTKTTSYIPVVFREDDQQFIPTPLRALTRYTVSSDDGYEKLYRRITKQPKNEKPKLGMRRELPALEAKSGSDMYVFGPINIDLWDQAKWKGTFFITSDENADNVEPIIGLGFRDEKAARSIFEGLIDRYGANDEIEELRVSIIEGSIDGEEDGYTVHIGCDWEKSYKRLSGRKTVHVDDLSVAISRINRMNPIGGNTINLDRFKNAYKKNKVYRLIPGLIDETKTQVEPFFDLQIRKSQIYFRHVDEIGANDPDTVVFGTGKIERGGTFK